MEIAKTTTTRVPASFLDRLAVALASAGGAGFVPKAPGTAGAAVGVMVYLAMEGLHLGAWYPHAIIFFLAAGIWASFRVEKLYGHDSQRIVIDEVVGQMITFAFAAGRFRLPVLDVIAGFGLRSEEHTSELQSLRHLVCRLLLEKKTEKSVLADIAQSPGLYRPAHQFVADHSGPEPGQSQSCSRGRAHIYGRHRVHAALVCRVAH